MEQVLPSSQFKQQVSTLLYMNFMNPLDVQSQFFQMDITFQRKSGENCNLEFRFAMGKYQVNTWIAHLLLQQFGLPIQK